MNNYEMHLWMYEDPGLLYEAKVSVN